MAALVMRQSLQKTPWPESSQSSAVAAGDDFLRGQLRKHRCQGDAAMRGEKVGSFVNPPDRWKPVIG